MNRASVDFPRVLRALIEAQVEFVVIGGMAAVWHGSARVTYDLDLVYERSQANIARLVAALAPFSPYLRGAPPGLPFHFDAPTVHMGLNFTLTTTAGDVDVLGEVVEGGTFGQLRERSLVMEIEGMLVRVVDLPTLIRLKRAAGRPKDLEAIAELEALLEEIERGPPNG